MTNLRASARIAALALAAVTLAACAGATAPSPTPGAASTPKPTPTAVPGDPGNGTGGGGSDPGSGGGIVNPNPGGVDPNQNPLFGQANYLTPVAGLLSPHPVNVQLVRALENEDGTIVADLRWWSGVAPCNQLDHVEVARDDAARTIRFTVIEGAGKGDIACIEIAELHGTTVDLGTLAPGEWTLSAEGDAPAIKLQVE